MEISAVCSECSREQPLTHKVNDQRVCQACYRRHKRRERGLQKPGPKPRPGAVSKKRLSPEEKARRAEERSAARTHCKNGHERTPENVYWYEDARYIGGKRLVCRLCQRNWHTKFHGRAPIPDERPIAPHNRDKTHCVNGHPLEDAYLRPDGSRACKTCAQEIQRVRAYGFESREALREWLDAKGGVCETCGRTEEEEGQALAIDHHHDSGRVRGLLCGRCNRAVGLVREQAAIAEAIAAYLRRHEND